MTTRPLALLLAAVATVSLSGCVSLQDVRLPGGAARGDDIYRVSAEFEDALDLVPQAAVKVNNVTVGAVEKIERSDWHARVVMRIEESVRLPANAVATLGQTSLLGEKYVALDAPTDQPAQGRLADGAVIALEKTTRGAELEEVLSALAALLNGGGVAQLKTISEELNRALSGREDKVRSLLARLERVIGGLDEQKANIVRAIDGMDRLSRSFASQDKVLGDAIDSIGPAVKVLADQRENLTTMLTALSDLGRVGSRVIRASSEDTIADLKALQPVLDQLNKAGADLPNGLEFAISFPYPATAGPAIAGDFANTDAVLDLDLKKVLEQFTQNPPYPGLPPGSTNPPPSVPEVPGLPGLPLPLGNEPQSGGTGGGPLCPPVCLSSTAAQARHDVGLYWMLMGGLA